MVLGFAFDDLGRVALIEKKRPDWQAGLLNGIGGKLEDVDQDRPIAAMQREFREETGVDIDVSKWVYAGGMTGPGCVVDVYTVTDPIVRDVQTKTDESVSLVPIHRLSAMNMIGNVFGMISLILAKDRPIFTLYYNGPH